VAIKSLKKRTGNEDDNEKEDVGNSPPKRRVYTSS
jgi:hypothetical protein